MGGTFALPPALLSSLRAKYKDPWQLGHAIGLLFYHISPLVSTHLSNPLPFTSPIPSKLAGYTSFVAAIDADLASLRLADGAKEKLSGDGDRKERARRKKYVDKYTKIVEVAFKACVREGLGEVFKKYGKEETKMFNKGVDKALSGVQWIEYPIENVVYAAGTGNWAAWLRGECERLGMERVRGGMGALEGM